MADILAVLGLKVDAAGGIAATNKFNEALDRTAKQSKELQDDLKRLVAEIASFTAVAVTINRAVNEYAAFEKQLAQIATIAGVTSAEMKAFGAQLRTLATELPVQGVGDLAAGLNEIIGAGIPAGEAMDVLTVAANAAVGGVTSVKASVDVLTTVLNGFAQQNVGAAEAADVLFGVVDKGKISFDQLANSFGSLVPVAAAYNISLQDVGASVATLTANGLGAEQAIVGVRSAIVNILNPTSEFTREFPKLAAEFNRTKLEGVGFNQFLADFVVASGGSKDALNALFRDIQGNVAVQSLLVDGGEKVLDIQAQLAESSGKVAGAQKLISETSEAQAQILRNNLQNAYIELGQTVLPLVNAATRVFTLLLVEARENMPALIGLVTGLGGALITYRVALLGAAAVQALLTSAGSIKAFIDLAKTVRNLAGAVALLQAAGGGIKGLVSVIAGLAGGFAAFKLASAEIDKQTAEIEEGLTRQAAAAGDATDSVTELTTAIDGLLATTGGGGTATVIDDKTVDQLKQATAATQDRVKAAQDALTLVGLEGAALAKRQNAIRAENAVIEAKRDLTGEALAVTERGILRERELADALAEQLAIRERNAARQREDENIANLAEQTRLLQEQADALDVSAAAYDAVLLRQRQDAAVSEAQKRAKEADIELTATQIAQIRTEIADQERLTKVLKAKAALAGIDGGIGGVFNIPPNFDGIGQFADGVSRALSAAQGLASAFGETGRAIGAVVGQSAQLLTNLSRAQQSGIFKDKQGVEQNVGFLGALSGQAGVSGTVAAVSSGLGIAGAAVALADSLDLFGTRARERKRELQRLAGEFNDALEEFGKFGTSTTQLQQGLEALQQQAEELAAAALKASGITFTGDLSDLDAVRGVLEQISRLPLVGGATAQALGDLNKVLEQLRENQARLRKALEDEIAARTEDLQVRALAAAGDNDAADALRRRREGEREIQQAIEEFGDVGGEYIEALRQVIEAERAAADAARERAAAQGREDERRRISDLTLGALDLVDPRAAAAQRAAEEAQRRVFDAIREGASEAELAAIAFYNAALEARRQADLVEQDRRTSESLLARGVGATQGSRAAEDFAFAAGQRQELADAVRSGMSETNLNLLRFVQFAEREELATRRAIEDGTKAIEDARDNELADIQVLIDVTRDASREQIAAIDRQIAETQRAADAAAKGFEAQIAATQKEAEDRLAALDLQAEAVREQRDMASAQLSALEENVSASREVVTALQDFRDGLLLGEFSPLSPEDQLAEARRQFETLASAALGGDASAAGQLPEAANALLSASRGFNASNAGFVADFERVQSVVTQVQDAFGAQLPIAEQQLEAARAQVRSLDATLEGIDRQRAEIERQTAETVAVLEAARDKAAEDAQRQIDVLTEAREKISADAEATIAKLDEQRQAIIDAADKQIEQLIAAEEAALATRLRENEFYDQFALYQKNAEAFFEAERERDEREQAGRGPAAGESTVLTGGATPAGEKPVSETLAEQVTELRTLNRELSGRLDAQAERIAALVQVSVRDAEQTDVNLRRIEQATNAVVGEVRALTNVQTIRNQPVGIGR